MSHGNLGFNPDGADQIAAQDGRLASAIARARPLDGRVRETPDLDLPASVLAGELLAQGTQGCHVRAVEKPEPLGVDHARDSKTVREPRQPVHRMPIQI